MTSQGCITGLFSSEECRNRDVIFPDSFGPSLSLSRLPNATTPCRDKARLLTGKAILRYFNLIIILFILLLPAVTVHADLKAANAALKRGDYPFAFSEAKRLADHGDPKAQYMLAGLYEAGVGVIQNYAEAFKWYSYAAQKGDPMAQVMVAQMYYEGKGGPRDYQESAKWYREAAEKGHIHAQNNLGVLYEYGRGVTESKAEALKWYLRAAEHGVAEAQCKAGVFYAEGIGLSQDFVRAYAWFEASARNGNSEAGSLRDALSGKMTQKEVSRAKELASKIEKKAFRPK